MCVLVPFVCMCSVSAVCTGMCMCVSRQFVCVYPWGLNVCLKALLACYAFIDACFEESESDYVSEGIR